MTQTLTYPQRYAMEKIALAAIPTDIRQANAYSHTIGNVDDCNRCIHCEIAAWNAWQRPCF
jgi:hypothetical protein